MSRIRESGNKKAPRYLSLAKLFPNIITITAICFGLSSIRYALDQKWEIAVILIIIAGVLDLADGRLARFLNATSNFGAYLDSLADFINFGVAPAIVIYLWKLGGIVTKGIGWALVLFFAVCMAIRLARFNSDLDDDKEGWSEMFFKGVPAPIGAYLALMPMMVSFRFEIDFSQYLPFLSIYIVIIALLLVSTVPTFSTKKIVISREYLSLFFSVFALILTVLIIEPWLVLPILGVVYLIIIPFSYLKFNKLVSESK